MKKIILLGLFLLFFITPALAQVTVIAHKSVPVEKIDKNRLLDLYTGDVRSWSKGLEVVVFDLKPKSHVKKTFYGYLGKTPSRMKSIWMKRMLSGEGDPPKAFETEEEILRRVASTPGAIGFVSQSVVTDEVKILVVIQKE